MQNNNTNPVNSRPSKHRTLLIVYVVTITIWVICAISFRIYNNHNLPIDSLKEQVIPYNPNADPLNSVELGLYIKNITNFDPLNKNYGVNGWVWIKWPTSLKSIIDMQKKSPEILLNFVNKIDDWDFILRPINKEPLKVGEGMLYQKYRFSGHFFASNPDFRRYPFEKINLPVILELGGENVTAKGEPVGLIIDQKNSGINVHSEISGYRTKGFDIKGGSHEYITNMGNSLSNTHSTKIPFVKLEINHQKYLNGAFLKLIVPLVTIMTLTLFTASISSSGWDIRVGIPPTVLLSLIFLQQSYLEKLPELHYITFLDSVYNICYLINLVLFGLFLWGGNEYHAEATEAEKLVTIIRIDRINRNFQIGLTLLLIIGVAFNWTIIDKQLFY